jgi:5-methylcytosine-specific restriction endonuclease McrA
MLILPDPSPSTPSQTQDDTLKTCSTCGLVRPSVEFNFKNKPLGLRLAFCRDCQSVRNRDFDARNPGRRAEYARRRREKDPAAQNAIAAKWREANPEKASESRRRYRESEAGKAHEAAYAESYRERRGELAVARRLADPEKYANYQAEYRETRREEIATRHSAWIGAHPEAWKVIKARSRHRRRKLAAGSPCTLTAREWSEILGIQKNKCARCKRRFTPFLKPQKDHIVPLSMGGGLTMQNCQALCRSCNSRKGVGDTDYRGLLPGFLD